MSLARGMSSSGFQFGRGRPFFYLYKADNIVLPTTVGKISNFMFELIHRKLVIE